MMVVVVLMTSCQVSLNAKSGPDSAQPSTGTAAAVNAQRELKRLEAGIGQCAKGHQWGAGWLGASHHAGSPGRIVSKWYPHVRSQ